MSLRFIAGLLPLAIISTASGFVSSCAKEDMDTGPAQVPVYSIAVSRQTVPLSAGQTFVSVKAPGDWTLEIKDDVSWARLSALSGHGNKADIFLDYDRNDGEVQRICTIVLKADAEERSVAFIQAGNRAGIVADQVGKWMELPATDDVSLYFFTYPMTIDNRTYRNFSYYWDMKALVAHWVAYPLNSTLLKGSCGRTDAWGLDPKLPEKCQPVLYSGISGYQRGHQIPSADRQIKTYNEQTFYFTNMTPQNGSLNTGAWSNLENYVRTRCRSVDTLYVVSGCVVKENYGTVSDNVGKKITVPSGYFKALLAYKKNQNIGITGSTRGYTGVAFYYDNKPWSKSFLDAKMTIDELEVLTGIDFFVNLPDAIGSVNADKVESTLDNWWIN